MGAQASRLGIDDLWIIRKVRAEEGSHYLKWAGEDAIWTHAENQRRVRDENPELPIFLYDAYYQHWYLGREICILKHFLANTQYRYLCSIEERHNVFNFLPGSAGREPRCSLHPGDPMFREMLSMWIQNAEESGIGCFSCTRGNDLSWRAKEDIHRFRTNFRLFCAFMIVYSRDWAERHLGQLESLLEQRFLDRENSDRYWDYWMPYWLDKHRIGPRDFAVSDRIFVPHKNRKSSSCIYPVLGIEPGEMDEKILEKMITTREAAEELVKEGVPGGRRVLGLTEGRIHWVSRKRKKIFIWEDGEPIGWREKRA
jgi:hypothetical protein